MKPSFSYNLNNSIVLLPLLVIYIFWLVYEPVILQGRSFLLSYLPAWLFSSVVTLCALTRQNINLSVYILIYLFFSLLCAVSIIWSIEPATSLIHVIHIFAIVFILPGIWFYCSSKIRIKLFMRIYMIATASAVVIGFLFSWSAADRIFLGVSSSQVVFSYGVAALMALLSWALSGNRLWLLAIVFFMLPMMAVGSLKGVLLLTATFVIFQLSDIIRKVFRLQFFSLVKLVFLSVILFALVVTMFEFGPSRLNDRVVRNVITSDKVLSGEGGIEVGASGLRIALIFEGVEYLGDNLTLFGEGIASSYKIYEDHLGIRAYSHTNIIDLLMGVGVIGTILFYMIFFRLLARLMFEKKINYKVKDSLFACVSWMLMTSLIGRIYASHEVFMLFIIVIAILKQYSRDNFCAELKSKPNSI
jgi:hypothetical protein